MIRIPMEKWERTFSHWKDRQWQRMGATVTHKIQYEQTDIENDGVFYINLNEYMCLDFNDPQWETWFKLRYSEELVDNK